MSSKGDGGDMSVCVRGESLTSRSAKITQLVLEKGNQDLPYRHLVSRDALLDALFLLYDECNNEHMRRNKNIGQFLEKYQPAVSTLRQLQVNINDFEVRKIIGKGHFGEVHLVQEKQSGNIYAMKILRKALTLEQQSVAFYEEERDIMMKGSGNPWLTSLQYSFQDSRNLYLVMEFLPGGDMLSLLERNDNLLPEDVAQFYLAEIVLAIHSLHTMGYVHRDIKPDNILVDRTGHIKLADFGSAAKLNENKQVTSKMPVGTPDYIAPEVLTTMNKGAGPHYGVGCDWWSLGIVAYEMLFGVTPFGDDKVLVTYANIMNFKEKLSIPDDIKVSDAAISVIKGLLQDQKSRISYKELYDHEFFKGIDWVNIQKLVPPYVPTVSSQDDTSYFDDFELDTSRNKCLEPFNPKKEFSGKNLPFVGFTYSCCLSYVSDMYAGFNDTLSSLSSSGSFMRSSLTLPRNHGRSSSGNSKETQLKKQVVALEAMESSLKSEVGLLKSGIKRSQEQAVLHKEERDKALARVGELDTELNSIRHLLDLERKNSVNTERRAVELLKAIEAKYKKREALFKEAAIHACPSLSKHISSGVPSVGSSGGTGTSEDQLKAAQMELALCKQELQILKEQQEEKLDLNECIASSQLVSDDTNDSGSSTLTNGSQNVTVIPKEQVTSNEVWQERLKKTEELYRKSEAQVELLSSQLRAMTEQHERAVTEMQAEHSRQVGTLKKAISRLETSALNHSIRSDQSTVVSDYSACEEVSSVNAKDQSAYLEQFNVMQADLMMTQELLESSKVKYEQLKESSNKEIKALEAELSVVRETKLQLEKSLSQQELEYKSQLKNQEAAVVEQLSLANEVFQEQLSQLQIRTKEVDLALSQLESEDLPRLAGEDIVIPTVADPENPLGTSHHLTLRASTGTTNLSPEILHKMHSMETVLHKIHETQISENNQLWELKAKLWKCEKEVANKQVDVRIAEHDKRDAQMALAKSQEVQRTLQERLSNLEKLHSQCPQKEATLRDQLTTALQELASKEETWQAKLNRTNSDKQVLEERISVLKEERKSAKELEEQHARSEGQYQELDRENERLRERIEKLEDEKQHLSGEAEVLKLDLKNKTKSCQQLEKSVQALKAASATLEEMTKDLENALETHEKDLLHSKQAEAVLQREVEKLQWELKAGDDKLNLERSYREEQEACISELKKEHAAEVQSFEDRIAAMERELSAHMDTVHKLSSQVVHLEKEVHTKHSINRSLEARNSSLEDEVLRIKEEATSYITTIAQLRRNGIDLQESLETAENRIQEAHWTIEQMHNDNERLKASYQQERVKQDAQLQQHAKLIDLLQQRLKEQVEKKKKWLFGLRGKENTGKENKGPTTSKFGSERKRDRGFRHYVELKEAIPRMTSSNEPSSGPPERTASLGSVDRVSLAGSTSSSEDSFRCSSSSRHIFFEMALHQSVSCVACTLLIPSGKSAARCRGCDAICHNNCKELLPRDCSSQALQNADAAQRKPVTTADLRKLGGWVKVPRSRNAGWESRFMRLMGGRQLWISDQEVLADATSSPPGNTIVWDLCPASGVVTLKKALNPGDLQNNTTDLENMIKLTLWPDEQDKGNSRDQIILFAEYEEKWRWCQALELPLFQHLRRRGKVIGYSELKSSIVLNLEQCPLKVTCVEHLTKQFLLVGSDQGLHLVDLQLPPALALKGRVFPSTSPSTLSASESHEQLVVHKVILARRLGVVLIVTGADRQVLSASAADLQDWAYNPEGSVTFNPVCFLRGIQQMVVSQSQSINPVILAACSCDVFYLLKWNTAHRQFVIKQDVKLVQPCLALHISSEVVLFAADKIFVVDLKEPGTCVEEFLDSVNANALTLVLNDILKRRNSPVAIYTSCPDRGSKPVPRPIQEEYILLTRDMGVVVNCLGQQDHQNQLSWALQPNSFAYVDSLAFGLDSQKIEMVLLDLDKPNLRGTWVFLELPQATFLGQCTDEEDDALFVAAVTPGNVTEIFRLRGKVLLTQKVSMERPELDRNTSIISIRSDAFSYTSSVEDVLDTANSSTC